MKSIEVKLIESELVFIADHLAQEIADEQVFGKDRNKIRRLQRFLGKVNDALNQIEREEQ